MPNLRKIAFHGLLFITVFAFQVFSQTIPDGKRLKDFGILIGVTAENGSSQKEGLIGWKDVSKVQTVVSREFGLVQTTAYPAWSSWGGSGLNSVTFNLSNANSVINWAEGQGKKTCLHLLAGRGNRLN
jgi:hypothetical protein